MEPTLQKHIQPKTGSNVNRPRRPDQWKRNRQKLSRVSGLAYETTKGTIVLEKQFQIVEKCCVLECSKKIDASSQQYLFEEFWRRGKSKQIQDLNLAACLRKIDIKRQQTNPSIRNRTNQWQYYLRLGSVDVRVCRKFIGDLYQIGEKRLRVIQKKIVLGETSFQEKRGRHHNRPTKTPENVLYLMKEHIISLVPLDDSFFFSAKSKENARLDFKKLYNSFSQYYEAKTETAVPISYRTYLRHQTQFKKNSEFILSASGNEAYLGYETVDVEMFPEQGTGSSDEVNDQDSVILVDEFFNETHLDQDPLFSDDVLPYSNTVHQNHDQSLPDVGQPELDENPNQRPSPSNNIPADPNDHHNSSLPPDELSASNNNHDSSSLPDGLLDSLETLNEDVHSKKLFQPVENCCVHKCYQKFEVPSQQYLFDDFWNRGKSKQIQDLYLASCFTKANPKTQTVDWTKRRRHSWHFFIRLDTINVRVCLKFLLNLYHVSQKRIRIVQRKILRGETSFPETRGGRRTNQSKLPPKVIQLLKKHIFLIPHYESSAQRRHFENPDLNLKKIFDAFRQYYQQTMGNPLIMKFRTYEKLFQAHSLITFSSSMDNQCDFCISFKSSLMPSDDQFTGQMAHEDFCKTFIELKDYLLAQAKQGNYLMIEFDYTPSICIPRLNVIQEVYQQLPLVHGFNVHNHCDDSSYMYLFPEGKTDKNIDTIISFLFATIQPILESKHTFQKVILLCNDCQGQSKQIPLVQFCSWMSSIHRIPFVQFFPVLGHSVNICSQNFALFREKNIKRARLIHAKPILEDMVSARSHPSPFIVSFDSPIVNRWSEGLSGFFAAQPKNTDKQKFLMQSYMQLKYFDGKVYANSTFYNDPHLWTEFTYLIKNIEIGSMISMILYPSVPSGVVPVKRQNVFSFFHLLTSEEIIKFQESFGI